jgi:hypothetical protein
MKTSIEHNELQKNKSGQCNKKHKGLMARFSILVMTSFVVLGFNATIAQTFNYNGINYMLNFESWPTTAEVAPNPGFSGAAVIPSTVVYNGNDYEVKFIGTSAFLSCTNLTSVEIPNTVNVIRALAFFQCSGLTSISIPNSVFTIGNGAFAQCSGLTFIDLPNSVGLLGSGVFNSCSSLTTVNLPNSITSIGSNLFINCSSLTSVNIPNTLTAIPGSTFANCFSLTTVEIPSSITSIGGYAFANCSSLTTMNIPNSITTMGIYAFANCFDLTSVTVNWPIPLTIDNEIFFDVNLNNVTLNVPSGTLNIYQNTAIWQDFNPILEQAPICLVVNGTDEISSCAPITWIDGNTYNASNNSATHLLPGAAQNGCDSLVTLNFTLWPCTELRAIDCGATNVTMNQILRAINVGMPQYRFRITGANNGGPGWNNNQFIYDTPIGQNHFRFQFIPGSAWGATYAVEVAVGDGAGNYGPYGNVCNVTLENQITTQIVASTCGATVTMDNFVQADWAPGAVGYRFRIQGANNGGAGWSGNAFIYETTAPVRSFKFNNHIPGALFGETYSIDVAVLSGDNVWLPYGSACNVTIAAPSTQIQASQCGITGVALNTSVLANNVIGASGYRFRITGVNSANWINNQFILNRPNRVMQFQMVAGTVAGEVYQIEVAVMDANGNYGAYGSACNVTVAGAPAIAINNESFMADKSFVDLAFGANANHNPFTTEFGIQVLNANDNDLINVTVYDMSGKLIERNAVDPMDIETARFGANLASGMYMVEVRQGSNQAVIRQVKN